MISTSQFKIGMAIKVEGTIYIILDFQHVKPGKGQAFVRTRLKNLKTGGVIDRNFRAGEEIEQAILDLREMEFLYSEDDNYYFMDTQTFEQIVLDKEKVGEVKKFLKENLVVGITIHEGKPVSVEPPIFVELKVVQTEPGVRGDTASGGGKPATLETGLVIQVPLFVKVGDIVKVDTRTCEYVTRV